MKVLLDTNVLARSGQPRHPQYHAAVSAVEILVLKGNQLCATPQVFYEFWSIATRPVGENGLGMSVQDAYVRLRELQNALEVLHDLPTLLEVWSQLALRYEVKGKSSHDARLVAAMSTHGVSALLTFNKQDFLRYPGLKVLTPEEVLTSSSQP
ncbi:MAG TPA: type II toxin-antitoxin system VapC family toxin [Tepidisphaeraceae bacterium]|jgi:predicted nucleic acid-binding protein|nr:type II toxin-antitoxin system VapC family toxin [Tepidisphaeraceae bacterium]